MALLAVTAVVLVLVFVVFNGDDAGKTVDTSEPEKVVETFFKSLEKQDARMLVSTMEPAFADELESILGKDYIQVLDDYFFMYFPESLKVTIRKMETDMEGDRARVTVVDGTMSWTEYGEKFTEEAADADLDAFELVRVDGEWYISEDTLIDWGFDFSGLADLGDLDFDDGFFDDDNYGDTRLLIASEDDAVYVALAYELSGGDYPTIYDWYWATNSATYDIVEEDNMYLIYFYEFGYDGTDIPFGWFAVEKETGEVYEVTNY